MYARFCAGAFEDDVEAGVRRHASGRENAVGDVLGLVHRFLMREFRTRLRALLESEGGCGGVDDGVDEAVLGCELETGLVHVDADDGGGTLRTGEGAGEEADGAGTEDENLRALLEARASGGMQHDTQRFRECALLEGDAGRERMEPVCGMVHRALEGAVEMRAGLGGRAEAEVGAQVVPAFDAAGAGGGAAGDATFDRDAHPGAQVGHAGSDGRHDPRRFVAQRHRVLQREGAVRAVCVVVD